LPSGADAQVERSPLGCGIVGGIRREGHFGLSHAAWASRIEGRQVIAGAVEGRRPRDAPALQARRQRLEAPG
jgi:hypothetical protein